MRVRCGRTASDAFTNAGVKPSAGKSLSAAAPAAIAANASVGVAKPGSAAISPAKALAFWWSSPRRPVIFRMATRPQAASTPDWRSPPPSTLRLRRARAIRPFLDAAYAPLPEFLAPQGATIVCRCEEVTAADIRRAVLGAAA